MCENLRAYSSSEGIRKLNSLQRMASRVNQNVPAAFGYDIFNRGVLQPTQVQQGRSMGLSVLGR